MNGAGRRGGELTKVLIVDDQDEARSAYDVILRQAGYDVVQAAHGGEAIRLAREAAPDLIVMDLDMPVVDGVEATRSLRHYVDTAGIPVLAITGRDTLHAGGRAESLFDGVLRKPCSVPEILAEVQRLLDAASSTRGVTGAADDRTERRDTAA